MRQLRLQQLIYFFSAFQVCCEVIQVSPGITFLFTGYFGGGYFIKQLDCTSNEQRGLDFNRFYQSTQQLGIT
ncbi:hypothetical protein D3C80_1291790 [compost metagenome]